MELEVVAAEVAVQQNAARWLHGRAGKQANQAVPSGPFADH
jgi:hypothetical protein